VIGHLRTLWVGHARPNRSWEMGKRRDHGTIRPGGRQTSKGKRRVLDNGRVEGRKVGRACLVLNRRSDKQRKSRKGATTRAHGRRSSKIGGKGGEDGLNRSSEM